MSSNLILTFLVSIGILLFIFGRVSIMVYKERRFKDWLNGAPKPFSCKGEIIICYDEHTNAYTSVEKDRLDLSTIRGVEGVFRDVHNHKLIYLCYGMGAAALAEYKDYKNLFWEKIFENSPGVEIIYTGTYEYILNNRVYNRFRLITEALKSGDVDMGTGLDLDGE